jgi:aspartyl protease family protein
LYIFSILILTLFSLSSCERKSGRRRSFQSSSTTSETHDRVGSPDNKTVVKMQKVNGVYQIPAEINGLEMDFIFDTGASDITISDTEAMFLYKQGKLTQEDIIGKQDYMIADGSIAEGTIINLKTVRIGNKVLSDVKASIVHNTNAPLLLGQSALSKFGKISIDYNRLELRFE